MTVYLLAAAIFGIPTLMVAMVVWDTTTRTNRPPSASYRAYEGGRSGFTRTNYPHTPRPRRRHATEKGRDHERKDT